MTDRTTIAVLLQAGEATRPAIRAPEGRRPLTHAGLRALAERTVAALNAQGIGREDRVAMVIPNGPEAAAAFVAIAKAPAEKISAWAKPRGWSQIPLLSGAESSFQADYKCQGENDDMQWPVMLTFRKIDGRIHLFWSTETMGNHVDTVWPYWSLMDFTPEGRPDLTTPPQNFRSQFLEKHYLSKE